MAHLGPTAAQLRKEIDRGRAGSKVDHPDPTAAPLGTDDEAAGTPPSPAAVAMAHRHEVENAPARTSTSKLGRGAYIYAGILAVIIAALSATALWLSQ
jgi:hypothetical protein